MKIGNFPLVARAMAARDKLVKQRDSGKLVIMIDAEEQDAEMTEWIRPRVAAELNRRIDEIDEDLRGLGVDVDTVDPA